MKVPRRAALAVKLPRSVGSRALGFGYLLEGCLPQTVIQLLVSEVNANAPSC